MNETKYPNIVVEPEAHYGLSSTHPIVFTMAPVPRLYMGGADQVYDRIPDDLMKKVFQRGM